MVTQPIPSAIAALRDQLLAYPPRRGTPSLLAVTGASGAGKTALAERLRALLPMPALCFDSLGVPTEAEMAIGWDDGRAWQKAMTWHWVQTAKQVYRTRPLVLLEGSFDPQYAVAACHANRVPLRVVALDVDPATRQARLATRGQPELATPDMTSWSAYLCDAAKTLGGHVLDARGPLDDVADRVCAIARELLGN